MSEHTPTIEKIDHLLNRAEHDSGYQAFVYMRKIWPHLKMTAESHEALVKALADAHDAMRSYLATFDRCGGSESVSAGEFAEGRERMRDLVGGSKQP